MPTTEPTHWGRDQHGQGLALHRGTREDCLARECGPRPGRRRTADTITDDVLDRLYARLDANEHRAVSLDCARRKTRRQRDQARRVAAALEAENALHTATGDRGQLIHDLHDRVAILQAANESFDIPAGIDRVTWQAALDRVRADQALATSSGTESATAAPEVTA